MKEVYFLRRESDSSSHADPVERSVGLRLELGLILLVPLTE